jgi:CubicO group peptidase (beta-lactamase class C family)
MPLPGWSVAKSVLNALVGILVGEGRLELTRRDLLREWASPDPRAAISVEDLLRMRSGLRFSEGYANPWSDVLHMLYNCHDTAAFAASLPLAQAPGTVWSYSSGTSNILSLIVRQVVGEQSYHLWPRRALFDRIGMTSAVLEPDGAGTFVCSSYMLATARDWARYGQLFVDDGVCKGERILPGGWVKFSTTPTPQSDGRFGAHWWLKLNPEIGGDSPAAARIAPDAFFAVGHEGQTLTVIPSQRLVVVRLGASIYIDAWNHAEFIANVQDAVGR